MSDEATRSHSSDTKGLPPVGARLSEGNLWVEVYARSTLPTRHGTFEILTFHTSQDDKEHVALVDGPVRGAAGVAVRLHSECLTGDVLGSLRCDCRQQLEVALDSMGSGHPSVLLYLRQEGRGIGLGNKIRAYALQDAGLDTYEANAHLGFDADLRDYAAAALMLKLLGVGSVRVATNNPRKIFGLRSHGVDVAGRLPIVIAANPHNDRYLSAKARKAGHLLSL